MRLIDRVQRGWIYCGDGKHAREIKNEFARFARSAYLVDSQNVCDWIADQNKHGGIDLEKSCPISKMPFPEMFFEYTTVDEDGIMAEVGILFAEMSDNSIVTYVTAFIENEFERDAVLFGGSRIYLDENFRFKEDIESWSAPIVQAPTKQQDSDNAHAAIVGLVSICFFHCKNVRILTHDRKAKIMTKSGIVKKPDVHWIEIHKGFQQVRTTGSGNGDSIRGAHIVRGHFKEYTKDKPLLGKHVGIFFWNMHMAGKGAVSDDPQYRVYGPHPKHAKGCVIQ